MLKINCLHTAQSDIAAFEAARRELGLDDVILKHRVRADLLARAEELSHPGERLLKMIAGELVFLARGADALVLSCPTLGRLAAPALGRLPVHIVRADAALAAEATADGGSVIVLCVSSARIAPTRALFEDAGFAGSATVEVQLIPGAAELALTRRDAEFLELVAETADMAADGGSARIALAETSMAGAARIARSRPLVLPVSGLAAAVAAARAKLADRSAEQA